MNCTKEYGTKDILLGMSAYVLWGLLPLYWKYLQAISAYEILANRIIWSMIFVLFLFLIRGRFSDLGREMYRIFTQPKLALTVCASGIVVSANWGIYIWAVNNGHIMDSSLGYYINPLLNMLLGVVVFHEKLSSLTRVAVGCAVVGVLMMIWRLGIFPWIALAIAGSFALYGLLKKIMPMGVQVGLFIETLVVTPLALMYIGYLYFHGQSALQLVDSNILQWLPTVGIVTAVPLLMFAAAAQMLPFTMLGFLQYFSPTIALIIGIFVYGEIFTMDHLISFGCIWLGLILFTYDGLKNR